MPNKNHSSWWEGRQKNTAEIGSTAAIRLSSPARYSSFLLSIVYGIVPIRINSAVGAARYPRYTQVPSSWGRSSEEEWLLRPSLPITVNFILLDRRFNRKHDVNGVCEATKMPQKSRWCHAELIELCVSLWWKCPESQGQSMSLQVVGVVHFQAHVHQEANHRAGVLQDCRGSTRGVASNKLVLKEGR